MTNLVDKTVQLDKLPEVIIIIPEFASMCS